jgi:NAD(P)-dependent dehydrogenase (short-subunit alcohol dehydrogenase family)
MLSSPFGGDDTNARCAGGATGGLATGGAQSATSRAQTAAPSSSNSSVCELRETSDYSLHRLVPMRQLSRPRQIADAVLYLASQEASYITGTTLSVAGGR